MKNANLAMNRKRNGEVEQSVFPPKCFPHIATYQLDIPSFLWHHFDNYFDCRDFYDYVPTCFLHSAIYQPITTLLPSSRIVHIYVIILSWLIMMVMIGRRKERKALDGPR